MSSRVTVSKERTAVVLLRPSLSTVLLETAGDTGNRRMKRSNVREKKRERKRDTVTTITIFFSKVNSSQINKIKNK